MEKTVGYSALIIGFAIMFLASVFISIYGHDNLGSVMALVFGFGFIVVFILLIESIQKNKS